MTARNENEEQALQAWFSIDHSLDESLAISTVAEAYRLTPERMRELINETIEGT